MSVLVLRGAAEFGRAMSKKPGVKIKAKVKVKLVIANQNVASLTLSFDFNPNRRRCPKELS